LYRFGRWALFIKRGESLFRQYVVLGDFPSAVWWAPAIQCLGSFSSGAPSSAPARRRRDPEGFLVIFPLFLDLSVSSEN
jgi:hypothetical protein